MRQITAQLAAHMFHEPMRKLKLTWMKSALADYYTDLEEIKLDRIRYNRPDMDRDRAAVIVDKIIELEDAIKLL